jgi:uncharacterized hydrophobic protein (TIGR00271 family)
MASLFERACRSLVAEWNGTIADKVPEQQLLAEQTQAAKPSISFFVLLICSAVIATLGLLSNSSAVVIGAMIIAPLMDPILSLALGLAITNVRLIKRSIVTLALGTLAVFTTSFLLGYLLDASQVNSEIAARTSPNLLDLGIAIAAGVAAAYTICRQRLANSLAGVAIAVALVPPLCVTGIGFSLNSEVLALFRQGYVVNSDNPISENSFLLFLVNLIGITVASLIVFMSQRYGAIKSSWANLIIWLGLTGLLSLPLVSALSQFKIKQDVAAGFANLRAEQISLLHESGEATNGWKIAHISGINVDIHSQRARIILDINAQNNLMTQALIDRFHADLKARVQQDLGFKEVDLFVKVIPRQTFRAHS